MCADNEGSMKIYKNLQITVNESHRGRVTNTRTNEVASLPDRSISLSLLPQCTAPLAYAREKRE